MEIVTLIAIALSPAIAVLISIWVHNWREKRQHKKLIFSSLMSSRHQIISDEIVRALNMIDVVFYNKKKVRELWHEYYDMLLNEGLNNSTGWKQRDTKRLELIHEMAKAIGYGKEITHIDVDRVYMPVGLAQDTWKAKEIADELLRVLKESGGLRIVPKEQPEKTNRQKEN